MRVVILLVLTLTILAGCGQMPETAPPTLPPTAPNAVEGAATPSTPTVNTLTLGDLATRVNAAWSNISSYRTIFTTEAMAAPSPATPVASPIAMATPRATPVSRTKATVTFVREVTSPEMQRQEVTGLGANDHEAISTGDALFLRGPLVEQIDPDASAGTWLSLNAADIPAGSVLSQLLGGLPAAPPAPLASVPERLWPQQLRDLGTVAFDGRQCRAYGAADTITTTGMRIDYTFAVDDQNLPCFIETSTGGTLQGREEFLDIDADLSITPPTQATPVSVPPALATPVPHD